jgi:hypothetical protein
LKNVCRKNSPTSPRGAGEAGWSRQGPAKSQILFFHLRFEVLEDPWIHVLIMGEMVQDASECGVWCCFFTGQIFKSFGGLFILYDTRGTHILPKANGVSYLCPTCRKDRDEPRESGTSSSVTDHCDDGRIEKVWEIKLERMRSNMPRLGQSQIALVRNTEELQNPTAAGPTCFPLLHTFYNRF